MSEKSWSPVSILMYHVVLEKINNKILDKIFVTEKEFAWQMNALLKGGYNPITLPQLSDAMSGQLVLPKNPFIVTFDDGYVGVNDLARPILKKLNIPYTVFLVTELVGKSNVWDEKLGMPKLDLMDWDTILDLQKEGLATFEPHTMNHVRLADLPLDEARREIAGSKETLEERLGKKSEVFCFPYGSQNDAVAAIAHEIGYKMAVTTEFGRVRRDDNPLFLPRIGMQHVPPVSLTYGIGGPNFWWRIKTRKDNR
jgi:peptidoglycan/xylan/chitin deacetylase (PgdA/CDA1 family)